MQRAGETYGEYQRRIYCENASILGTGISVHPQCCNGRKEYRCTVKYNAVSSDTFELCGQCRDNLKKEARRHGYKFKSVKL
jgi:hypothetical protein